MGTLEGKVAIVTGGASGQGAAEARRFVAEGAKVVLTDVNCNGEGIAAELGKNARFLVHDVSDQAGWNYVAIKAVETFGAIDILINNAGIYQPLPISDTTAEIYEKHYKVNQLGVFFGMQAVIKPMTAAGGGCIVNISSVGGIKAYPNSFAYCTSKWAVTGMTKCAALDLAPFKIRVNSVHPGVIDTPMLTTNGRETLARFANIIPLRRYASADEVAQVVAFIASDQCSYMTGSEICIDGGIVL